MVAGKTLLLITRVHRCTADQSLPVAQIFTSSDGGGSWLKHGPALEGSEIDYAYSDSNGGVWLAGLHTAEGPGLDPFLLVPEVNALEWSLHTIYDGPAELRGMAAEEHGRLSAWIRHVDLSDADWGGPIYRHVSVDGGRTWTVAGRSKGPAASKPGRFVQVGMRSGSWRVSERGDGGFEVQRRSGGAWETVSRFPWHDCGDAKR